MGLSRTVSEIKAISVKNRKIFPPPYILRPAEGQNRKSLKFGQNYAYRNPKLLQLLGDFCPPDPLHRTSPHFVPGLRPWRQWLPAPTTTAFADNAIMSSTVQTVAVYQLIGGGVQAGRRFVGLVPPAWVVLQHVNIAVSLSGLASRLQLLMLTRCALCLVISSAKEDMLYPPSLRLSVCLSVCFPSAG